MIKYKQQLDTITIVSLIIFIVIGGFYAIPYIEIKIDTMLFIKRIFYMFVITMMFIQLINRGISNIDKYLTYICSLFVVIILINVTLRREFYHEYIYFLLSIVFIWLIVNYMEHIDFHINIFIKYLRIFIVILNILLCLVLLLCLLDNQELIILVSNGFGDNRVAFSTYLSQIIFLNLFLHRFYNLSKYIFISTFCLLILQVFTGSRIGVVVSVVIIFYFISISYRSFLEKLIAFAFIILLVFFSNKYQIIAPNIVYPDGFFKLTRGTEELNKLMNGSGSLYKLIDNVSSYRLEILVSAIQELDIKTILMGKGATNFDVFLHERYFAVHNIFLKILGEYGIFALLLLIVLVTRPFMEHHNGIIYSKSLRMMWSLGIVIASLQPNFLITGLGNCAVMWVCYALLLKRPDGQGLSLSGFCMMKFTDTKTALRMNIKR